MIQIQCLTWVPSVYFANRRFHGTCIDTIRIIQDLNKDYKVNQTRNSSFIIQMAPESSLQGKNKNLRYQKNFFYTGKKEDLEF